MTDPMIGRLVGSYRIEAPIREGGMGAVYRAVHPQIGNTVAIKVLGLGRESSEKDQARFLAEARTTATLNHTNIVRVYDFVVQDGIYYMLMDFIDGESLDQLLAREGGRLRLSKAAAILSFVARALDYAHNRGVVHRDVKPPNILLAREDDRVVLSDFGIAKITEGATLDLTRDGATVGTPYYMSPEQASGKAVDARSDVYSLGVVLYEMLTGAPPFTGGPMEVLSQHVAQAPPSPRSLNPDLTPRQESVILKALEKDPEARYQRAGDLAAAFLATVSGTAEIAIATGSRWERLRETRAWGRLLRIGRFVRAVSLGTVGLLARGALSLVLGASLVIVVLLLGLSAYLGATLGRIIGETDWRLDTIGPGFRREILPSQMAQAIEERAALAFPGLLSDLRIEPKSATAISIRGMVQGIPLVLDIEVRALEGRPVFAFQRLNNWPLPIVGGLIARGLNQGFEQALEQGGASIPSIEISSDRIVLVIDGSATQTQAVLARRCVEGVSLQDDFSDIYSGWTTSFRTAEAAVGYVEGAYSLQTSRSNIIVNQSLPCSFTRFDASVDAQAVGTPGDASWGLVFFETDPDNYWVAQINAMGWFSVERVTEGEHQMEVYWTQSGAIETESGNTIRVIVSDEGRLLVNDQELATFQRPADASGSFGFLLRSGNSAQVEIRFDNLVVTQPG